MKNLVRKSMFVLSFLGLFTFATPKQSCAKSEECPMYRVCCGCDCDGDGEQDCYNIRACSEHQLLGFTSLLCGVSIEKVSEK